MDYGGMEEIIPSTLPQDLKDIQIKVDTYFLRHTGLAAHQCLLKLGEYNLMVVPAVLSLGGGSVLVALTPSEVALFSRFTNQLHTLTLGFQALESDEVRRIHIRIIMESITPVSGKKDVCLIKMKFKTTPAQFEELVTAHLSEQQVRKSYFQQTQGDLLEMKPGNVTLLGYNGYCEAMIPEPVRVALRKLSVREAVVASTQGWGNLKAGDNFSLKLYFKKFQFLVDGVIHELPENPRGEVKVSLGFSNELLDIMEDYQFRLTMLKKKAQGDKKP